MTQTCTLHIKKGTRQGEALQMMAHCANKPLSVVGHTRPEGFEKAVPFGDLPALEIDLQMYSQVVPLQRFYGKVCGFVPNDPVEVRILTCLIRGEDHTLLTCFRVLKPKILSGVKTNFHDIIPSQWAKPTNKPCIFLPILDS